MMNVRAHEESRYRLAYLTSEDIAAVFNAASVPRDVARIPRFRGLPPGYEVVAVDYEHGRRGWVLILFHPSWPEVPEGHRIPDAVDRMAYDLIPLIDVNRDQAPAAKAEAAESGECNCFLSRMFRRP